jgi:hypothetical protein
MPQINYLPPALQRLLLLLLLTAPFLPTSYADTKPEGESPLSANHYLIPDFSNHLLQEGRLIYGDLLEARDAERAKHTLALRLALADASGHLLQLSTPPSLAGLRQQMVAVRQALAGDGGTTPATAWAALIKSIKELPMHRADQPARVRLHRTAERGRQLTARGDLAGARAELSKLIGEIEITSHVFPITTVRKSVGDAVKAASAFTPHWKQAHKAIAEALRETRWITTPEAERMIHAFDAMVAAYVQFPDSTSRARNSLQHAVWWLKFDRHQGDASLLQDLRRAAQPHSNLSLQFIGELQTRLAYDIHHDRLIAQQAN